MLLLASAVELVPDLLSEGLRLRLCRADGIVKNWLRRLLRLLIEERLAR